MSVSMSLSCYTQITTRYGYHEFLVSATCQYLCHMSVFVSHVSLCVTCQSLCHMSVYVSHVSICVTCQSLCHMSVCVTCQSLCHMSVSMSLSCYTQITTRYGYHEFLVSATCQYLCHMSVSVSHVSLCVTFVLYPNNHNLWIT